MLRRDQFFYFGGVEGHRSCTATDGSGASKILFQGLSFSSVITLDLLLINVTLFVKSRMEPTPAHLQLIFRWVTSFKVNKYLTGQYDNFGRILAGRDRRYELMLRNLV
jgi:hypothetical protein